MFQAANVTVINTPAKVAEPKFQLEDAEIGEVFDVMTTDSLVDYLTTAYGYDISLARDIVNNLLTGRATQFPPKGEVVIRVRDREIPAVLGHRLEILPRR